MAERHLAAGLALVEELAAEAQWEEPTLPALGQQTVRWSGPTLVGDDQQWRIVDEVVGPGLYAGASGIALALAGAYRLGGEPRLRSLAVAAGRSALAAGFELAEAGHLDLAGGASGLAHAVARVGVLTGRRELRDDARELTRRAALRLADAPADPDFLSGSAGAIVALLATSPGDAGVRAATATAAQRLAELAQPELLGTMWPSADAPTAPGLLGLAHGTSGTALALLTAAAHGASGVAEVGWAAWDRERSWFDPHEANWPDLRAVQADPGGAGPASMMVAWCHGAVGIGCVRLRLLRLAPESPRRLALLAEVSAAVEASRRRVMAARAALREGGPTDVSLCHGLTGAIELLLEASQLPGAADHARAAARIGDLVLAQYEHLGRWPCGLPAQEGEQDPPQPPGLFLGRAGIALGLLRLAPDARLPGLALPQPLPDVGA